MVSHLSATFRPREGGAPSLSLLQQRSLLVVFAVDFVGRDDNGGGDLVVWLQVEQTHALGGAAGGANGLGVDADDLAELADDHQLRSVVDQLDGIDLADAVSDGHVLDAAAAAGLETVLLNIDALAEAVLGNGEDAVGALFVFLGGDGDPDDVIVLAEIDAPHPKRRPAHGADIAFIKPDRHAQVGGQEHDLRAVGDAGGYQFV